MDEEIFKSIPGYDGMYEVSNYGRVKSLKRKIHKFLKPAANHAGYLVVALSKDGKVKQYKVHRLVLMTFNPVENMDKLDVNHKDGNKLNNNLDNLEWCTRSENINHSYQNGLQKVVTNPHGTFNVLNQEQLNRIYELHSEGLTDKEIANIIGCSRELVGRKIRKAGLR